MAAVVPLASLSKKQVKLIKEILCIQPVDPEEEERKKWVWKGAKQYGSKPAPPVLMWRLSPDKLYISLPYRFACGLLKQTLNLKEEHIDAFDHEQDKWLAELREYQIEPAMTALNLLKKHNTVTIGLPPGYGKTIIGFWLMFLMKKVGLMFVHRDTIGRQWIKTVNKCVPGCTIWFVGDKMNFKAGEIPHVIVCMKDRYNQIPDYIKAAIGTVIVDEFHCFCTPSAVEPLLSLTPRYIIGESATLERDDGMHAMAQSMVGMHGVFKVSDAPYTIIKLHTNIEVEETKGKRGTNFIELCKSLDASMARNVMICDIVHKNPHRKFIILTHLKEHVSTLNGMMEHYEIKSDTLFGDKSDYSDSPVLIGTTYKMGVGFDEENACKDFSGMKSDTLILANSMKKRQAFEQFRGRVMRAKNPIVIWMYDKNKIPRRHFKKLVSWIEETNGTIIDMHYVPGKIILADDSREIIQGEILKTEQTMQDMQAIQSSKTKTIKLKKSKLPIPAAP